MINRTISVEELFKKRDDRILVITQLIDEKRITGLNWTNEEAFLQTVASGYCHYYDDINNCIYLKGEHSGEIELIHEIKLDCCHARRHIFHLLYLVSMQSGQCKFGVSDCHFYTFDFKNKIFQFDSNLITHPDRVNQFKNRIETLLDIESDTQHQKRFAKLK